MSLLETPAKNKQEEKDIPETGIKEEEQQEYEPVISGKDNQESLEASRHDLDRIEEDIGDLQKRLKQIEQQKKQFHQDSEDYTNLDQQTRVLKKEAIDLDYQHRIAYNKFKKQQKQANQAKKAKGEENEEVKTKESGKKIEQKELDLAKQRYDARIRQIQLELAQSSLRRSRRIQAQADLIAIRALEPYHWWRYYDYPYYYPRIYRQPLIYSRYLDPLYYDPIYYPYRYPLYSDLLYPRYSYLGYI